MAAGRVGFTTHYLGFLSSELISHFQIELDLKEARHELMSMI
jgi:hypothetical protein